MAFVQIDLTPSIRYFFGKEAGRASIWATKTAHMPMPPIYLATCFCLCFFFWFFFVVVVFFFHQSQSLFFKHIVQFTLREEFANLLL